MSATAKPNFTDQYIFITGAGRGLGQHVAKYLAACGAIVGVADLDASTAAQTVAEINATGQQAFAYSGDMADQGTFLKAADDFAAIGGRIDAIINNAMLLHYCPVDQVEDERLSAMMNIGIKAPFWASQALLKHMDARRGANMINMSSPVAHRGYANTSAYSAVKGAVTVLTKVLAAELGPKGIRVNAVSPASVPTPGALGLNTLDVYEKRAASNPLRRIGSYEDNSNAIAFLLSDAASFINGEILNVDGGASAVG